MTWPQGRAACRVGTRKCMGATVLLYVCRPAKRWGMWSVMFAMCHGVGAALCDM
jgi:hypothetical protein